jgi:hypothetical protein
MRKIVTISGLVLVVSAILAVAFASTVFAAGGNADNGTQTRNQGKVRPCVDCVCSDCTPNEYFHNYNYSTPGPNGFQKGVSE